MGRGGKIAEVWKKVEMEGTSLKAETMPKVPELVVRERMTQGDEVRGTNEKKKVKGWSAEEINGKPCSSLVEDVEDMLEWRSMGQEAQWVVVGRIFSGKMKGSPLERGRVRRIKKYRIRKWREDCWQESSPYSENATCSVCKA